MGYVLIVAAIVVIIFLVVESNSVGKRMEQLRSRWVLKLRS
jgi:hypothetical protein